VKAISVLGSTGSIGTQTLEIVDDFPERFRVVALSAGRNLELLVRQIQRYQPEAVALADRVILISEGRMRFDGTPLELRAGGRGLDERFHELTRGVSV
jgi:1-deoxy-D-xylulose-5-phosphate reductoisomerase